MYFTSSFKYASTYSKPSPHGKVFLIALTEPGNSYPVTELPFNNPTSLLGQACKTGYQSHYLEATAGGYPAVNVGDQSGDELVVFEQTLPLFLVYTTEFGGRGLVASVGTETPIEDMGSKEWIILDPKRSEVNDEPAGMVSFQLQTK